MKTTDVQQLKAVSKKIRGDVIMSLASAGSFPLGKFNRRHDHSSGNMAPIVFELFIRKKECDMAGRFIIYLFY